MDRESLLHRVPAKKRKIVEEFWEDKLNHEELWRATEDLDFYDRLKIYDAAMAGRPSFFLRECVIKEIEEDDTKLADLLVLALKKMKNEDEEGPIERLVEWKYKDLMFNFMTTTFTNSPYSHFHIVFGSFLIGLSVIEEFSPVGFTVGIVALITGFVEQILNLKGSTRRSLKNKALAVIHESKRREGSMETN